MDALALTLLRPARRTRRAIAALVVLALVGWLGVSAGHLHLPEPASAAAVADCGHAHGAGAHEHGPLGAAQPGHDHHGDGDGNREHHPGAHPCSLCLSLERGAGPAAPPALVVARVAARLDLRAPADALVSLAAPAVYRSRAPPVA